jgi:hypothetical protein
MRVGGRGVGNDTNERERELEILEKIYCETRASRVDDRCMNISRIFFDACLPSTHYTLGGGRHCGVKKVCVWAGVLYVGQYRECGKNMSGEKCRAQKSSRGEGTMVVVMAVVVMPSQRVE